MIEDLFSTYPRQRSTRTYSRQRQEPTRLRGAKRVFGPLPCEVKRPATASNYPSGHLQQSKFSTLKE